MSSVVSLAALLVSSIPAWSAPATQNGDFAYVLTTQSDPARPGEPVPFAITVTNISSATESTQLSFVMPNHLSSRGYPAGATFKFDAISVGPGASKTLNITPTIDEGASAPADGTMIELTVRDLNRATSVSRSIEVQSAREEELRLSKSVGDVAPGSRFTYTLTYHNGRSTPIQMAKLRLPIPAGATFVSADAGGTVANGIVQWPLGNLADAQTGQVQATFIANAFNKAPLLLDATLLDAANQVLAQASDAMVVNSAPVFSYALSTQDGNVKPGGSVAFTITVTNRTNTIQDANLSFVMPNHVSMRGYPTGATYKYKTMSLDAGASHSLTFTPSVVEGTTSPPDGSIVNFIVRDIEQGASVSRSIVVQSTPPADLKISTQGGTVAPLGKFTYTLSYHNQSPTMIAGAKLSLPVPVGATFVSADAGGVLFGGVVQWSLGNLPDSQNGQVQVTLTAPPSSPSHLFLEAKLRNGANQVLAHADDVKTVAAFPTFSYALSTQNDTAKPGELVPFTMTITNLTNSTQNSSLSFVMPNHASIRGYSTGTSYNYDPLTLAAGASSSVTFTPEIFSGDSTPPDGTIINFVVRDPNRGAAVSRRIVVQSQPKADLKLSTNTGTVAPGGVFSYLLTYHNPTTSVIVGTKLVLPVPAGATFVSANGRGALLKGAVVWNVGNTAPGATYKVQANFRAPLSNKAALLFHAQVLNGSNQILAEASEIKTIQSFPVFAYELLAETAGPIPGGGASYMLKITNLTNSTQDANLSFTLPNHTTARGYPTGGTFRFDPLSIAAKSSSSVPIAIIIDDGDDAPITGSIINLVVQDLENGASVSHTLAVNRTVETYGMPIRMIELSGNLNFGQIPLGQNKSLSLTIRNRGNAPLTVSKITLPNGFTGSLAGVIPAGGERSIAVNFKPSVAGPVSGSVVVFSDKTIGNNTFPISGVGASRVLALGGNLNFGTVAVGTAKSLTLTLKNNGNSPLSVTKISLPPGYSGKFKGTIKAGESKRVRVKFRPTAIRKYDGKVVVVSNKTSGGDTVPVSGKGAK